MGAIDRRKKGLPDDDGDRVARLREREITADVSYRFFV